MVLQQANTDTNGLIFFFRIAGILIAAGIFSLVSGLFVKLSVRLVAKKSVNFGKAFWISFFSILAAFIFDKIVRSGIAEPASVSFLNVLPAIVFFVLSWFLISHFVRFGEEEDSQSYLKALLAAALQMVFLTAAGAAVFLATVLVGFLMMHSSYTHYQLSSAPKPSSGKANVVGTVIWKREGAANIEVQLCQAASYKLSCEKYKTVTNDKGDFIFADVEPGFYAVKTRLFETDHFATRDQGVSVFVDSDGNSKKYEALSDRTMQVDDQIIYKNDLKMVSPLGGVIKEQTPLLTVENYPDAFLYHIFIIPVNAVNDYSSGDFYCIAWQKNSCSPEKPLPEGTYLWKAEASIKSGKDFVKIATSAFDKSDYGYFTVFGTQTDSFVLQSKAPSQGAVVTGKNLTIEGEKDARAGDYVINVYDENFKKLSNDLHLKEPKILFGKEVKAGKYFYEIKAFDKMGRLIGMSGLSSFQVQ